MLSPSTPKENFFFFVGASNPEGSKNCGFVRLSCPALCRIKLQNLQDPNHSLLRLRQHRQFWPHQMPFLEWCVSRSQPGSCQSDSIGHASSVTSTSRVASLRESLCSISDSSSMSSSLPFSLRSSLPFFVRSFSRTGPLSCSRFPSFVTTRKKRIKNLQEFYFTKTRFNTKLKVLFVVTRFYWGFILM